jgi:hypothetical protein
MIHVYPDGYTVNVTSVRVANRKAMNLFMIGSSMVANVITILGVEK